jgi:hypothetical protein
VYGGVRRIVWATEAVVVVNAAADEMTPSNIKVPLVDMRHATGAKAIDVVAKASDAINAQTTHVTSAKAAHTATKVSAALGSCARGKQAAGKRCACQNHHHSSSHDMFHLNGRIFRHRTLSNDGVFSTVDANIAIQWK